MASIFGFLEPGLKWPSFKYCLISGRLFDGWLFDSFLQSSDMGNNQVYTLCNQFGNIFRRLLNRLILRGQGYMFFIFDQGITANG